MTTPDETRSLLLLHGTCRSQPASDWTGDFTLPDAIADFYFNVGPVDIAVPGYGNPTSLPSLSKLWERQMGYRYNAISGERFQDWPDSWIVVADEGADPYIFCEGSILFAEHGTGEWSAELLFDNIYTMASAIAALGRVVSDAGLNLTDDNCNIRPAHLERAFDMLTALFGNRSSADSFLANSGWGQRCESGDE